MKGGDLYKIRWHCFDDITMGLYTIDGGYLIITASHLGFMDMDIGTQAFRAGRHIGALGGFLH